MNQEQPTLVAKKSHLRRNLAIVGIVIVAALLVTVFVSSFAFGLYGCFGGCGRIPHISGSFCYATSKGCQLEVVGGPNSDASANIIACSFTVDNSTVPGTVWPPPSTMAGSSSTVDLPPGQTVPAYCLGYPDTASPGTQVDGLIQTRNGWFLPFSSTWS